MEAVLIIDCGATNVRVSAVSPTGQVLSSIGEKNETQTGAEQADYHIWDLQQIWEKVCSSSQKLQKSLPDLNIQGIAVTTFGVDGAPYNSEGQAIYPIISWKCPRTKAIVEKLKPQLEQLYLNSGVGEFSFNTLYKLVWLKEHRPDIYSEMKHFVFISSMLNHRLTGVVSTDRTMAGTSMLTSLKTRELSPEILELVDLEGFSFPNIVNAGDVISDITAEAAQELGLKNTVPVISAGHDTQFALFASGAEEGEPVLSSGTWEILMARSKEAKLSPEYLDGGITTELDAIDGLYNPGVQWLSSGFLEWLCGMIYKDLEEAPNRYDIMISEAQGVQPGANGVRIENTFLPQAQGAALGCVQAMSIDSTRSDLYRAALESLALQLRQALKCLETVGSFKAKALYCVGGGSRNALLNQIRADITGLPIKVVDEAETTVLGAAMFAFWGCGYYRSIEEARQAMKPSHRSVVPGPQREQYLQIFPD